MNALDTAYALDLISVSAMRVGGHQIACFHVSSSLLPCNNLCSSDDCTGLTSCFGHGLCVNTDTCKCDDGWVPPDCQEANCDNLNGCSPPNGFCAAPNTCKCLGTELFLPFFVSRVMTLMTGGWSSV